MVCLHLKLVATRHQLQGSIVYRKLWTRLTSGFFDLSVELNRKLVSTSAKLEIHHNFLRRIRKNIECNICLDIPVGKLCTSKP